MISFTIVNSLIAVNSTTFASRLTADVSIAEPTPDNTAFWAKGSVRNNEYEEKLKQFFPSYNTKGTGFLGARPDLVIEDYIPCSILRSQSISLVALNSAVRRDANVVEFTAIKEFTMVKLINYLREKKLRNYISATQEQ